MNNIIKRIISSFSYAIMVIGICSICATKSNAAVSSIIIDAESGEILSASAADQLRFPASLTKVMTLYITFDALEKGLISMNDKLPVSRTAANRSPSKLGLKVGEKITVRDAISALIIKSANDCATVLAEGLGYSEQNFAKTMTEVAKELGMKNTTFKNASGLPNSQQKTTARDMAILGAAIYHHFPQYYDLFSQKKFTYDGRTYYTHNHLLKSFAGADGMKTGYTSAAGYNIMTSAQRDGRRVIAVTMGHPNVKARDAKVASLMSTGLEKLALSDPQKSEKTEKTVKIASSKKTKETIVKQIASVEISEQSQWAIQVGAFSNYAKARNYANNIKKEINHRYQDKEVYIQPLQKGAAVIYRSQIKGFEKKEADNACNRLKKSNKSCIVVASKDEQLLLANKI